ncbi:MAG: cobyrinate a,c-diamide synthase [Peptococcaceae bacterium]|nr:MAG: cobyrinate a,c-diamide synthase [Peptococcaceae bacterium]
MKHLPRLMIAGASSGAGKTTVATAIMFSLARRGYRVQPYKAGPDYIDPGYHTAATGRICRNLDTWLLDEGAVRELFIRSAVRADLSIVEGVMGLYDGIGSTSEASSAHIARILRMPVLLVLNVQSMACSAAAVVLGYQQMDPLVRLAGVVLNRVGSERHYRLVKEAVEDRCRVPVVGYVPRETEVNLPERHLGLLPTAEKGELAEYLAALAVTVGEGLDLEQVLDIARRADPLSVTEGNIFSSSPAGPEVRIGIARDEAFNFYYQDGLDLLAHLGAELVPFSPLRDRCLPENVAGLYIGGGFPEMFLEAMAENRAFRSSLKEAVSCGLPVYAECGGLMYLSEAIVDFAGREYPAAGVIPGRCRMGKKRAALGYVTARVLNDNVLAPAGALLRGHEFHYSVREEPDVPGFRRAYRLEKAMGTAGAGDGLVRGNLLASYVHLHLAGYPRFAARFLANCSAGKLTIT